MRRWSLWESKLAVTESSDDGVSSVAAAMRWAQHVTTIGLEMAAPAWLGYWLDGKWGTEPWLVVLGAILGFTTGMKHLLSLARDNRPREGRKGGKSE